jgi:hypothetical protein
MLGCDMRPYFLKLTSRMPNYTGLIAHAKSGKCITAPEGDGGSMFVSDCDPDNARGVRSRQRITIADNRMTTEYRNNNEGKIDTYNGNLYWSGQDGANNDIDFQFISVESGYTAPDGRFKFYGWGRQGGHDASVNGSNQITQNDDSDGTPNALWIPYSLIPECTRLGVTDTQKCTAVEVAALKVTSSPAPVVTAAPTTAPKPTSAGTPTTPSDSSSGGLSTAAIAGIVVAIVVFCVCFLVVIVAMQRKSRPGIPPWGPPPLGHFPTP